MGRQPRHQYGGVRGERYRPDGRPARQLRCGKGLAGALGGRRQRPAWSRRGSARLLEQKPQRPSSQEVGGSDDSGCRCGLAVRHQIQARRGHRPARRGPDPAGYGPSRGQGRDRRGARCRLGGCSSFPFFHGSVEASLWMGRGARWPTPLGGEVGRLPPRSFLSDVRPARTPDAHQRANLRKLEKLGLEAVCFVAMVRKGHAEQDERSL